MTRFCHCVGHLTNPGGVCCKDLPIAPAAAAVTVRTGGTTSTPLTEDDVRRIIREELRRFHNALRT